MEKRTGESLVTCDGCECKLVHTLYRGTSIEVDAHEMGVYQVSISPVSEWVTLCYDCVRKIPGVKL